MERTLEPSCFGRGSLVDSSCTDVFVPKNACPWETGRLILRYSICEWMPSSDCLLLPQRLSYSARIRTLFCGHLATHITTQHHGMSFITSNASLGTSTLIIRTRLFGRIINATAASRDCHSSRDLLLQGFWFTCIIIEWITLSRPHHHRQQRVCHLRF